MAPVGGQWCWHLTVKVLPKILIRLPQSSIPQSQTHNSTSHPHIPYPTPLISDRCNQMRSTTKRAIPNSGVQGLVGYSLTFLQMRTAKIRWWLSGAYTKWMLRWGSNESSKWLIIKTSKSTVNDGGNGDRMKWRKCRVWLVLPPEKMKWLSPKCGDRSQHTRLRWVQSKEQGLNKPHRRDTMQRQILNADHLRRHRWHWKGTDDTDDTDKLRWTHISSDRHRMQQREVSLAHNLLK